MKLTDLKAFGFPGGERHLDIGTFSPDAESVLTAHIRNSNDLMDLILATDALKARSIKPSVLQLPYVPYARQDRRTTPGSPFSLKIAARLINDLAYDKVRIYEPHSPVTPSLIENCEVETFDKAAIQFISDVASSVSHTREQVLLSPDAGAVTRVSRIQEATGLPMAVALKKRDPETGWLKIKHVFGDIKGRDVFVLDDICDGGATFVQLAQYIRDNIDPEKATRLHLFVAHGIFSKGVGRLREWYDTIGTTDSFYVSERTPPGTAQDVLVYSSL